MIDADPPAPVGAAAQGAWSTIGEALRGSRRDFTKMPIGRAVFLLAVPMVLEMAMESLFGVVDIFVVSKLGADAVAVVGLTETLLSMLYALALGFSIAATAVVARRIGEKDTEGAAIAAVQVIAVAILASGVIGILGALNGPRLLALMGASPAVVELGAGYVTLMLGGNVSIVLLFVLSAVFRGAGDASIAMRALWLANLLNIILLPVFVFGVGPLPAMGVTGAAIATNIGRFTGVAYLLAALTRAGGRLRLRPRHVRANLDTAAGLMRIAGTGTLQILVETTSWLGLVRILADFGSASLAGYTIAIRIAIFALLPSMGLANAAATLVGQNLGAGRPDRAERSVWVATLFNMVFLGLVGIGFVVFTEPLVRLFTQEEDVVVFGVECLHIIAFGFFFYACGMVAVQAFNGAGDTATPTYLSLVSFWLFKIPLAYVLALTLEMGPSGVFYAIAAAYSLHALASVAMFRRGGWKAMKV